VLTGDTPSRSVGDVADPAPRSHVIADRYLTSPAALAAQPFGPVDALDTHSGRGAQVRIIFAGGEWDDAAIAGAVARWCGIGCSEVCGVLDFGRHGDRWFLVLPPSLGLPVERWRMLRRPSAEDAARLVLALGRLAERIAAAGFSPDGAALADVTVGPGPTPFLERPLLRAAGGRPAVRPGDGQRLLGAVWDAAIGRLDPPQGLREWADRARAGDFETLPECLDELARCGVPTAAAEADGVETPPGLDRLFDEHFDLDGPAVAAPGEPRRLRLAGLPLAAIMIAGVAVLLGHGARQGAASTVPPSITAPMTTPVVATPAARPARRAPGPPAPRHTHRRPAHRHRRRRAAPTSPPAARPRATPIPPAQTSPTAPPAATASAGGTTDGAVRLPAPGGTTLPAP
jgi:hypothetical protein